MTIQDVSAIRAMLEYLLADMESVDTVEQCRQKVRNVIELCTMHSIERIREEFGII